MSTRLLLLLSALLPPFLSSAQHQLSELATAEARWYENSLLRDSHQVHTAIRPWRQHDIAPFDRRGELLSQAPAPDGTFWNWAARKAFYEDFLTAQGDNYALTLNPIVHFSYGQDRAATFGSTYRNSRGARIEVQLGEHVSAYSTLVETQARLPNHVTAFAKADRVVPGYWLAKPFREEAWDYAYAAGEVAYTPNSLFHFRAGHGKQFIGEGHRSMLLSDNAINYPYFRIETTFGKVKYVNTWAMLNDIRDSVRVGGNYAKKYLSMHYLSVNIGRGFNIALFEGLMWGSELNEFGFDLNFLNPVILYRPVEFAQGFTGGNILMGLNTSYRFRNGMQAYAQFAMDEFTFSAVRNWGEGSWLNMMGGQLGLKWGDAFGARGLFLRAEYNLARPYLYAHRNPITNWGHYAQPLAHPWGANFEELILQAHYRRGRWEAQARFHAGQAGRDRGGENFGGNIFNSFDERATDTGVFTPHGAVSRLQYLDAELAYLFNPSYNLRLRLGARLRRETGDAPLFPNSEQVFFGLSTNVYRSYQDF